MGSKPLNKTRASAPDSKAELHSLSGFPLKDTYRPDDIASLDYDTDLGNPGEYPFTRGVHETMYRGRLWTFRQFAGFGSAEDTNARFKYLLENGQHGLSTAFDMPTLMGRDSDDPKSFGEVGRCGVAIDSLKDMEILFDGIPLEQVSTSMTINSSAAILVAMYMVTAEKQGVSSNAVRGTVQNDILKEYIAQKTYIYPPEPSVRLVTDSIEYCTEHMPQWNTVSISGYHIREAGSTAAQELAFTLADGLCYVEQCVERGMRVDDFAPRLSFFFNCHNDFFAEIAKYRAARRMWSRFMKNRFGAKDERSLKLRCHAQTAGYALTAQQPMNNVVRVTLQALAGILGGTQSLHTNSLDETMALPSQEAVTIALRTQQILAHESGVGDTADPFGGSYYLENLTNRMEEQAMAYITQIDEMGGMVAAIDEGYPQREIADAAFRYQQATDSGELTMVGVNKYVEEESEAPPLLEIDKGVEEAQRTRLKEIRKSRDNAIVESALKALDNAAHGTDNLMPYIVESVRAYATLGEICNTLREVFGEYQDPALV